MRKMTAILLVGCLFFFIVGCGDSDDGSTSFSSNDAGSEQPADIQKNYSVTVSDGVMIIKKGDTINSNEIYWNGQCQGRIVGASFSPEAPEGIAYIEGVDVEGDSGYLSTDKYGNSPVNLEDISLGDDLEISPEGKISYGSGEAKCFQGKIYVSYGAEETFIVYPHMKIDGVSLNWEGECFSFQAPYSSMTSFEVIRGDVGELWIELSNGERQKINPSSIELGANIQIKNGLIVLGEGGVCGE